MPKRWENKRKYQKTTTNNPSKKISSPGFPEQRY
jgi:hypothetical protein